ncbi:MULTISPECIES: acyl-CoA dehydrogenase family protein [Amycolatopsis]|uniref:Acyl-[acyl-carrier-protein] dehydrogenase MbtN n=1 Tax=Amycolatopsis echigonensis TaxID=2576905 RepID=A0A8E2AZZ1_9PSEU|nr:MULTISPECIES: acyl-CoA dehydrogenase family protein [Amycolatopsis]MBB2498450.1 acyl-CoA dehydrogenase family protein [Amycolatopsis echigonensis]
MRRTLWDTEHEDYRATVRQFVEDEIVPYTETWAQDGILPRELFTAAGKAGLLSTAVPEEYGGGGVPDFRFNAVRGEEAARAGAAAAGLGLTLHADICTPYFLELTTPEQKARWLGGIGSGEAVTAIAMTEPGIGSDLASMATTARREGDHYVVNGAKTFISNGINADLIILAVKTDSAKKHSGVSLLVVERGTPGFTRGRNLVKIGQHAQDTAELFFDDARVPAANLLGSEGEGFRYMTANLPQERLSLAVYGVAAARAALAWTLDYVQTRHAFGRSIGSFQNTRFKLAELATEVDVAQAFVDQCVLALNEGELSPADAAKAKWWCTELQGRAVDSGVQLHGGYGYMAEYPIAQAWADARITRIFGGTTEIMKDIVSKDLGLPVR